MSFSNKARLAKNLFIFSYALLLLSISVQCLLIPGENRQPSVVVWLIQLLPLLAFLPGIIKDNLRAYIWLTFVIQLYFIVEVVNVFNDKIAWLDAVNLLSIVLLFFAATFYTRWRSRALRASADQAG